MNIQSPMPEVPLARGNCESQIVNAAPLLAFTLLEIMLAIAILAMVVTAIYASWNSILKGSRVALDAAAAAQRTRITMRTLHDSLLCSTMFVANATNYTFEAGSDNDFSSLSFVARLPRSFPRSGKFGDLSMRRLQFTVENGEDSTHNLVLRQRPILMDFDKDEQQFPLVLARDVSVFKVQFVDPKSGDWVDEWDLTNQLPTEARITVGLGHLDQYSSEAQQSLVSFVALPSVAVRPEWQIATPGGPNGSVPGGPGININPRNGQRGVTLHP